MPILKLKSFAHKAGLKHLIAFVFLANVFAGLYVVFFSLNFLQVDLAGHIWSSVQFGRGYFHTFSDQIFLGYVHGLFYPPVEDLFLSFISAIVRDPFAAYIVYLGLLIPFYFFAVWKLIRHCSYWFSFLYTSVTILFLLNVEKLDLIKLQGLSLVDLLVTGLSAETLSMSFFLILIEDIFFTKGSFYKKTMLLTLVAMSHIVIGLVAFLFILLVCFLDSKPFNYIKIVISSLALSAFYWIPFSFNLSYVSSSTIFNYSPWLAITIASICWLISIRIKNKISLAFLGTAALLLFTTTFFQMNESFSEHVPHFHYYRFTMVAYFFIAIGIGFLIDSFKKTTFGRKDGLFLFFCSMIFVIHLGSEFKLQNYDLNWRSFSQTRVDFKSVGSLKQSSYGRHLVFGADRAADTGVEAILSANFDEFRSTKGLFWESSRTNNVQSSILATVLSRPIVLDNYFYADFDCKKLKCLLDQTFRYYNVNGVIGNPMLMSYLPIAKKICYQEIFNSGTNLFTFYKTGELKIANQMFSIFKLFPNTQTMIPVHYSNKPVEPLTSEGLGILDTKKGTAYAQIMDEIYNGCDDFGNSYLHTFVKPSEFEAMMKLKSNNLFPEQMANMSYKINFEKVNSSEFKITTAEDQKRFYVVKLSPQPGAIAYDSKNNPIPLFASYPYIIVFGSGKITLKFERTFEMYLGYIISVLALFSFVAAYSIKKSPLSYLGIFIFDKICLFLAIKASYNFCI